MTIQQLLLAAGERPFIVDAADFDGTNDYMTRGGVLTGQADSKTGIFSGWARIDGGNGTVRRIIAPPSGSATALAISCSTISGLQNRFGITAVAPGVPGTVVFQLRSNVAYLSGATWRHVLMSWDKAAGVEHLYVDDVDVITVVTDDGDVTLDCTPTNWGIGAHTDGSSKWNGALAEIYFTTGQYLDFSVEANRRKFISDEGKPVFLGTDGSLPTGTSPLIYLHLDDGEAVANFATNRGTGGNFAITGTLDTASSSPSD